MADDGIGEAQAGRTRRRRLARDRPPLGPCPPVCCHCSVLIPLLGPTRLTERSAGEVGLLRGEMDGAGWPTSHPLPGLVCKGFGQPWGRHHLVPEDTPGAARGLMGALRVGLGPVDLSWWANLLRDVVESWGAPRPLGRGRGLRFGSLTWLGARFVRDVLNHRAGVGIDPDAGFRLFPGQLAGSLRGVGCLSDPTTK